MNHIIIIYICNSYTHLSLCHILDKINYCYETVDDLHQLKRILDKHRLSSKLLFCDTTELVKLSNNIVSNIDMVYCLTEYTFPSIFLRIQKKIILINRRCHLNMLSSLILEENYFQRHGIDIILSLNERLILNLWKEGKTPQMTARITNKSVKTVYRYRSIPTSKYGIHKAMLVFLMSFITLPNKKQY